MPLTPGQADEILTYQLAVAWAGETGEDPRRLGWWKTDMVSRYGGFALFQQLAPQTHEWAAFEVAREAARRVDETARVKNADPDNLFSLFHLGANLDEAVEDRIGDHKREGRSPTNALPRLAELVAQWDEDRFAAWVADEGAPKTAQDPSGRRITSTAPSDPVEAVRGLARALIPFPGTYPCPHYRHGHASK